MNGSDYINDNFEISYRKNCIINNNEEVISVINDTLIVKNPKILEPFFNNVKGIIDKRGDLYLCSSNKDVVHLDIIELLHSRNLISKFDLVSIYNKLPIDFLSVQRLWNKDIFTYCNSYNIPEYMEEEFTKKVKNFFDKCKLINKDFNFCNLDLISAGSKHLNKLELKKFYKSFYY